MRIIYQGSIYEAVKVNDSIEKYAKDVYELLKKHVEGDPAYVGEVKDNAGNVLEVMTVISNEQYSNSSYQTMFVDETLSEVYSRIIRLRVDYSEHPESDDHYYEYYRDMIHELLHSIDPKQYVKKLVGHPSIGLRSYVPAKEGFKKYRNQVLERQIQLSDRSHRAVHEIYDEYGPSVVKQQITDGSILHMLTDDLRSPTNDKEFLKLCYYYYMRL